MTISGTASDIESLRLQLLAGSEKVQQQLISQLATLGDGGLDVLKEFLLHRREAPATWIDGNAYQILYTAEEPSVREFLHTNFPTGIVPLDSEQGIDYTALQQLLVKQDFEAADRLTLRHLCELSGPTALQRNWLYFTEVDKFPIPDLQTINRLWLVHSEGKFSFSVQREIWLSLGKNWESFWPKIGWKSGNTWTRYPGGFTWNLSAPRGHLPLSNQLRGVRAITAILSHPAWSSSIKN